VEISTTKPLLRVSQLQLQFTPGVSLASGRFQRINVAQFHQVADRG
jgi:hypothetical protein